MLSQCAVVLGIAVKMLRKGVTEKRNRYKRVSPGGVARPRPGPWHRMDSRLRSIFLGRVASGKRSLASGIALLARYSQHSGQTLMSGHAHLNRY